MTHLTLTGYYAGRPLCDTRRNETDKYIHAAYTPEVVLQSPDLCPQCKHVWDTPEEDEQ